MKKLHLQKPTVKYLRISICSAVLIMSGCMLTPSESEQTEVNNPNFKDNLTGWTKKGDFQFHTVYKEQIRIAGVSAEIRPHKNVKDDSSSLSQTVSVSSDAADTKYTIRAKGSLFSKNAPGKGYLRVRWDNDNNESNGFLLTLKSKDLNKNNRLVNFKIDTTKPQKANFAHIAFVVDQSKPTFHRYIFDTLSFARK